MSFLFKFLIFFDNNIITDIIIVVCFYVDKINDENLQATEVIERALYALETYLHPCFSLTSGNCHLDYRYRENRAFFLLLFKYARGLEARACTRTAFEIAKLLWNLNPYMDPLAMVLVMDYYAIRAKQYSWLIDFYEEHNKRRNLSQLPNMAYSYALALFLQQGGKFAFFNMVESFFFKIISYLSSYYNL